METDFIRPLQIEIQMSRPGAEKELNRLFGFTAFHDLQWEVIDLLLSGKRILFIEKTGYGKSLCYQFPATQLKGLTIVFSPLIALMRDQVRSMNEKGIKAASINSNQTLAENEEIIRQAQHNHLDLLYIAPERMENASWITDIPGSDCDSAISYCQDHRRRS